MPGHSGVSHYVNGAPNVAGRAVTDGGAMTRYKCPHCGEHTSAAVIATVFEANYPNVTWTRCAACDRGVVHNGNEIAPATLEGEDIEGLPADVETAYTEARKTAGAAAYTSCELMCRKILMHVAVDKGADEGKSFVAYLDYLANSGYVTPPMRPWVDLIRMHGNESTHRLPAASRERALNTLIFTAQLLRLVYEMEFKAQKFLTPGP